jgi:hypothetical protein
MEQFAGSFRIDESMSVVVPEVLDHGMIGCFDLLSFCCCLCQTQEEAIFVTKILIGRGLTRWSGGLSCYGFLSLKKWWRLFSLIEKSVSFDTCPFQSFLSNGGTVETYRAFLSREYTARNASIALIGVGRQRKRVPGALDAMRVIARVVYGGWQLEEKWEIPPAPAPAAAKRRRGKRK